MAGKKSSLPDKALFKRQVELLGFCLSDENYTSADLQDILGYEEATIGRDTTTLRSYGIDIHSVHRAMKVTSPIEPHLLRDFITQYIGYCYSPNSYDRATALLVKRAKEKALHLIIVLECAIEKSQLVAIDYEKERGKIDENQLIGPMMLFQADDEWRVLALNDSIPKQYILSKIRRMVRTNKTFQKIPKEKLQGMFLNMWQGWLGAPNYRIRLLLNKAWSARLNHRMFTETQNLISNDDGTSILEAGVPNLDEVAGWVVARGSGIRVLDPPELRERVIQLAQQTLKNYEVRE
jgi:predicted DNA-binding transcriptional regulator YafY